MKNLHTSDCLRANKSTMAWGLEARVPFLDKAFLEVALNVDPKEKMFSKGAEQEVDADGCPRMEKVRFRYTFDGLFAETGLVWCSTSSEKRLTSHPTARYAFPSANSPNSSLHFIYQPYLPRSILWRQKEQFSDGVGYSWIDGYVHRPRSQPESVILIH